MPAGVGSVEFFARPWKADRCLFGDLAVLCFLIVQCLDGALTYVGISFWGPGIEGNPLIATAVRTIGLGAALASAKLVAAGFGMLLHLRRVHSLVAWLTAFYLGAAILPWTTLFLTN